MAALRDQQRQETRRRLYEAALEIFRRDGVEACRIDDIVRAAGVSRGSFYFHFPTKDDVLIELMRETERRITGAIHALPQDTALGRVLDTVIESLAEIWEEDPSLLPEVGAVGLRAAASSLAETEPGRLRETLAARFRAAAQRGELSSLLPAEILSDLYLGHSLAGLLAWFGNQHSSMRTVLRGVTTLFWSGARGESEGTAPQPDPAEAASEAAPKSQATQRSPSAKTPKLPVPKSGPPAEPALPPVKPRAIRRASSPPAKR